MLELHGWGAAHTELNAMSKQGKWVEMGTLIDDEMLNTFAIVAEPNDLAGKIQQRYGDLVDRVSFYAPYKTNPGQSQKVLDQLKAL